VFTIQVTAKAGVGWETTKEVTQDELKERVAEIMRDGYQVAKHAPGSKIRVIIFPANSLEKIEIVEK
jgi:hypothetical protein